MKIENFKQMNDMTAVLVIKDKKLLVVHNTKSDKLRVEPPGGKKEDNESLEGCARREFLEETGLMPDIYELFAVHSTNSPEGNFNVYMYLAAILGEPKLQEKDKHSKLEWCSYDDLLKLRDNGFLVPNLCSALEGLKRYLI